MKAFIIDDDHLSLFLTQNILALESNTFEVRAFLSGSEALEALYACDNDSVPDIMFLDLNMPLMDGWQFLDALAPLQPKLRNKCSIYILTSSLDMSDTVRMRDYPVVSGFIHKPLKSEDVRLISDRDPLQAEVTGITT